MRRAVLLMRPVSIHWKGSLLWLSVDNFILEVTAFLYLVKEARCGPGKLGGRK